MSKLIFFGDSITAGAWDKAGGWAARVIAHLNSRTIEEEDFYCMSYNLGISGDCLPDVNTRLVKEIEARHDPEDSLVLVLAIGVNDSQYLVNENKLRFTPASFTAELNRFGELVTKFEPKLLLIGPAPVDEALVNPMPWAPDKAYLDEYVSAFNDCLVEWTLQSQHPFIDLYKEWRQLDFRALLCDGVHPNSQGHEQIYQRVIAEFEKLDLYRHFIENTE